MLILIIVIVIGNFVINETLNEFKKREVIEQLGFFEKVIDKLNGVKR